MELAKVSILFGNIAGIITLNEFQPWKVPGIPGVRCKLRKFMNGKFQKSVLMSKITVEMDSTI